MEELVAILATAQATGRQVPLSVATALVASTSPLAINDGTDTLLLVSRLSSYSPVLNQKVLVLRAGAGLSVILGGVVD